jgi:hypothetical protein
MISTWKEKTATSVEQAETPLVPIFVVATRAELLTPALTTARHLTQGLGAQIKVLAPYAVPYPLDLSRPPVASNLLEENLLSEKALSAGVESARILLCRDQADALLGTLPPESVVVIGAKKRWWRTKEDSLAAQLRKAGHQVLIAAV